MMTKEDLELLNRYNEGLALYKKRQWQEAKSAFSKALELRPEDGPSQLYIERIDEYIKNPPDDDWDGVFVMKTK